MAGTPSKTKNMFGPKSYQERARRALPILIRQASSKKPIHYEFLAAQLGMPNPRNLNWVLGSVGVTLNELASRKDWNEEIPQIQSLVINKVTRLPGSGFEGFLAQRVPAYGRLSKAEKRAYLEGYWLDIFAYAYWPEVLKALDLAGLSGDEKTLLERAKSGSSGGGGEGPEHKALKQYVCDNPISVSLPPKFPIGRMEAPLPSGDKLDVLFHAKGRMLGVEVKSRISNDVDLMRGLFQCVKYRSVMEAERGYEGGLYNVDAVLVVGLKFPHHLRPLQNSLGVTVIELPAFNSSTS
jgi:hypothetical protein